MSLATKYRPTTLDEVVGQDSVIQILKQQINTNNIKNCYLFCGPSGDGKTTIARALANKLNGSLLGLVEVDAASNNGVDNIRELIQQANERSLESLYKVIILDECHSLTSQSWQALLKTIEEPPKYTIFIFCTTDPQKIPATILNRCMRFNLNRIASNKIRDRLEFICRSEGFQNYFDTIDYLSKICNGQMRDAISYLEKVASYDTNLDMNNALQALGNFSYQLMFSFINNLIDQNESESLNIINDIYLSGSDLKLFVEQFLSFNLDVLKYILLKSFDIISIPSSMQNLLDKSINFNNSVQYYNYIVDKLLNLKQMLKNDTNPKNTIEVLILQICRLK